MKRRNFILLSTSGSIAFGIPIYSCSSKKDSSLEDLSTYETLVSKLLKEWADALISVQINQIARPDLHGALHCPACNKIHGRCMDAVYPFIYLADTTGEDKYLNAAIEVMDWSENVSKPDGSWTVIPNPKSWSGITVFGAIALGEALHHHGHILTPEVKAQWTQRLAKATAFIYKNFDYGYSHVNYVFTAIYALNFLGRYLHEEKYIARSRELAKDISNWLTEPNLLIFGEDKPVDKRSKKGLLPVDLGYNVEETLNGLVQYAFLEKDEELLELLARSMKGHLEFMLPDGAWDNSWGTRQNKWSYWGSRTTDGCQPAFSLMAAKDPVFGTAAFLNTELLERCTVDGLLAGGLHYDSHQVKPCIHHTFAHAKSLAFLLDNAKELPPITKSKPLPRSIASGVKHFPEVDVWLAAQEPWKATVSSYDNEFKTKYSQQATGGSLAVLWHDKVGPIFIASMAEYILAEKNNQQPQPDDEDIPLTPRIECFKDSKFFTNLFDLESDVITSEKDKRIHFKINTQLTNRDREVLDDSEYQLEYIIEKDKTVIKARRLSENKMDGEVALVLPIISPTGEQILHLSDNRIEVKKKEGILKLETNSPLIIMKTKRDRIFNMVPGFEAIPIKVFFPVEQMELICTIDLA